VNEPHCPSVAELDRFVDADAPPEQLARVERHMEHCVVCAKHVAELRELILDIKAPLPAPALDVHEHVRAVMARLDVPRAEPRSRWLPWLGTLAAAAVLVLFVAKHEQAGEFTARGSRAPSSLARDVGVSLYSPAAHTPLEPGSTVAKNAAFTAALRNVGNDRAYLLLFAVDSNGTVHWIAPEYTTPGTDPESTVIARSAEEHLLPTAAQFDDLASGSLRVLALVSKSPRRVSQIESLPPAELTLERLQSRFALDDVRQVSLTVLP
jgi:hypothetical protein